MIDQFDRGVQLVVAQLVDELAGDRGGARSAIGAYSSVSCWTLLVVASARAITSSALRGG